MTHALPTMRTWSANVSGEERALAIAASLLSRRLWFMIEPLVQDEFEVTVKAQHRDHLEALIDRCQKYVSAGEACVDMDETSSEATEGEA